ncbi:MAG TPA: c-type cytochrome [Gemmatimonadaceae bacterium]|nr:c-type cytochrome [Gemmatimonadaceae bacterium]
MEQRMVAGGDAARGARHIAAFGCGSCHAIPGIPGAHGRVGPPLDRFAERMYIAGALRNEAASLVRWIRFPQSVQPGTVMPDLGVSEAQARDIAAYLYTLGEGGLGPPHPIPAKVLPAH